MATTGIGGFRDLLRSARARLAAQHPREVATPWGAVRFTETGDGPPVLVMHGVFGGYDAGLDFARQNVPDGFRVIAPARFGYLGSTLPREASPAAQADAFAALLNALEIETVAVIALSAGSPSALQFVIRHPARVRALILCSAAVPGPHYDHDPLPRALARVLWSSELLMWAVCRFVSRPIRELMGVPRGLALRPEDEAVVAAQMAGIFPVADRVEGVLFDTYRSNHDLNRGYSLGAISMPTLVLHARDDPGPPYPVAAALAAQIPGARLVTIDRGGHLMLGDHPEVPREIADLLRRTAATVRRGGSPVPTTYADDDPTQSCCRAVHHCISPCSPPTAPRRDPAGDRAVEDGSERSRSERQSRRKGAPPGDSSVTALAIVA